MSNKTEIENGPGGISRRGLLTTMGAVSVGMATGLLASCGGGGLQGSMAAATSQDGAILNAASTAEALATVMYDNIIKSSTVFARLTAISNANDQSYLIAGRQQEAIHYQTLVGAGAKPLALTFYFPNNMFTDPTFVTTMNTLTTLEDTFIAAYLLGIGNLSSAGLRVLAGQIMGVECEHRAFARDISSDLGLSSVTGQSGVAEPINGLAHAANNLAFERTFSSKFPNINAVVTALGPFVKPGAPGFSPTPFVFNTTPNFYVTESPAVQLANMSP